MNWLVWIALGVLQGLTEFLPVSSSGHLVLAQRLFGLSVPGVLLEVTVHLGTALAVIALFAREIWAMLAAIARWFVRKKPGIRGTAQVRADYAWRGLATNVIVATAVTAVIGFAFQPFFRGAFEMPQVAATMLLVTGAVLFASRWFRRGRRSETEIGPADAIWIGAAQGLAILPGLSRSGMTIVGGLARKLSGEAAAKFSFLLSLPAIVGAGLVEAVGSQELKAALAAGVPLGGLGLAMGAAFVSGLVAMVLAIRLVEKGRLHSFSWYCWLVGLGALAWLYLAA